MATLPLAALFTLPFLVTAQTTASFSPPATLASSSATSCASTIVPQHGTPSIAPGWKAAVVVRGLQDPRGMVMDSEGALLVVEQRAGISRIRFDQGEGDCVRSAGVDVVIADESLNHGIQLSEDGKTLYASSSEYVYSWPYDALTGRNTSGPTTLVGDMGGSDHVTRTLLLSRRSPGYLLVSRGSQNNVDPTAQDITSGVSTIKAYNLQNRTNSAYNQPRDGLLLGWGLRNSVGVAEHPVTGGLYSVENSVDNFMRSGQNIHDNNPGEEMNFHGYLNGSAQDQGGNYGYPTCFATWDTSVIPNNTGLSIGTQFAMGDLNATVNDTFCREDRVAPRLTFGAHEAPLDMKFNSQGTTAWVTFHGSWNRDPPAGYKLSALAFNNVTGSPLALSTSNSSAIDILSNPDLTQCPDSCFRPVGLAWDAQGRLFMSSDTTGEIWVITRTDGRSADSATVSSGSAAASSSVSSAVPSATPTGAAVKMGSIEYNWDLAGLVKFAAAWAGIMAVYMD